MRKQGAFTIALLLCLSVCVAPIAQAKEKVTKPSAPTISAISSSTPKKGKVNVTVTITLPASNGGSKVTESKVTAGGKSCTIKKTKTSCTIKSIKNGKSLSVYANSKNIKGFGSNSARVAYSAGASSWLTTSTPTAAIVTPAPITQVVLPSAPASAPTIPTPLTCAAGGTCIVGDRGPGGGIVFYVSATYFTSTGSTCNTTCKYLEVAPATWQSAGASVSNDLTYVWSPDTSPPTGQDAVTEGTQSLFAGEKLNWKIGEGFYNTSVMKVLGGTSPAQAAVLAYAGNSVAGQWFIPSMNELNELCKYARGQATGVLTNKCDSTGTLKTGTVNDLGGFVGYYFSSSESGPGNAWIQYFADGPQPNGSLNTQLNNYKANDHYIRPVRAF